MFGSRIAVARMVRGRTRKDLADAVGVSPRSISDYEMDRTTPGRSVREGLARELGFPQSYFDMGEADIPAEQSIAFRARSKMTRRQRDVATATVSLAAEVSDWMDSSFELPAADLPDLDGLDPEVAASYLRRLWGLGEGPVSDMIAVMEAHGVRVFSASLVSGDVDAFSHWDEWRRRPFVFLTTAKSGERRRMDAAHELGHLVMHRRVDLAGADARAIERQANDFAAAFLMPSAGFMATAPRGFSMQQAMQIKKVWRVSVVAAIFRGHELGLLSDWQYHHLFAAAGSMGMRSKEPDGIEPEVSQVGGKVIEFEAGAGGVLAMARGTGIPTQIICSLMFRPNFSVVSGNARADGSQRAANRQGFRLL